RRQPGSRARRLSGLPRRGLRDCGALRYRARQDRPPFARRRADSRHAQLPEARPPERDPDRDDRGAGRCRAVGARRRRVGRGEGGAQFLRRHRRGARGRQAQERRSDGVAREPFVLPRPGRGWPMKPRSRPGKKLSHVDEHGAVRMVDVGAKPATAREAVARGRITMSREALRLIRSGRVKKGDPLQTARLAGILAAKRTADLIPLCHPLQLSHVDVLLEPRLRGYVIEARVRTTAQTGVEMEALTAVAVAALTIYDMVKAVDKTMVIGAIRLMKKTGGRSGLYRAAKQILKS